MFWLTLGVKVHLPILAPQFLVSWLPSFASMNLNCDFWYIRISEIRVHPWKNFD